MVIRKGLWDYAKLLTFWWKGKPHWLVNKIKTRQIQYVANLLSHWGQLPPLAICKPPANHVHVHFGSSKDKVKERTFHLAYRLFREGYGLNSSQLANYLSSIRNFDETKTTKFILKYSWISFKYSSFFLKFYSEAYLAIVYWQ